MRRLYRPLVGAALIPLLITNAALAQTLAADAAAETPPGAALTLQRALEIALEQNAGVRAAQAGVDSARGRRLQADGFEPAEVFYEWDEAPRLSPRDAAVRSVGVEQSFGWPGKRERRKDAADFGIDAAQAALARERLRIGAQVRKAYDDALLKAETARLLRESSERLREAIQLARVRYQSNTGQYLDVLRTQTAYARAENERRDAEIAVLEARARLSVLLGRVPDGLVLADTLEPLPLSVDREALARAFEQGPTTTILRSRTKQSEQLFLAARQGRYPDLSLRVARQRLAGTEGDEKAWAAGVGIRIPLPGSDLQRGQEIEASAESRALGSRAYALRLRAEALLKTRYEEARQLDEQIKHYREQVLLDANDQLKAAQQEYRVGRIDAFNLLDVYRTFFETRRAYLEALVRYRATLADLDTLGEDLWEIEL
jgi:outer membrane protein TolC